mmetsp:Transcript_3477/g.8969  ORF Transcript_3477/g.8969 Transcript_3477/m.8969 type:complete len:257 (-) Transcript_3477:450-1220(-)
MSEMMRGWDHRVVGSGEEQMATEADVLEGFLESFDGSGGCDTNGIEIMIPKTGTGLEMRELGRAELAALPLRPTPVESYAPRIFSRRRVGTEAGWILTAHEPRRMSCHQVIKKDALPDEKTAPLSPKESRLIMLECFAAAAAAGDVPSLLLLFEAAKAAAFQCNRHGEFADAIDLFIPEVKASMSYYSIAHDLAYYGVESGEAPASTYFASSRRLKQEYTRKAMLAYRNNAFESTGEGANVCARYRCRRGAAMHCR